MAAVSWAGPVCVIYLPSLAIEVQRVPAGVDQILLVLARSAASPQRLVHLMTGKAASSLPIHAKPLESCSGLAVRPGR